MYLMNDKLLRLWAVFKKELIVMKRDYATYFFICIAPLMQVFLFGTVINNDAKHIPTVVVKKDESPFADSIIQAFKNTGYFAINTFVDDEREAEKLMNKGKAQFILHIPYNFSRDLLRKKQPHLLLEGDASDPMLINNAFHAVNVVSNSALTHEAVGTLKYLSSKKDNFIIDKHAKYNPSIKAQYHNLPGLLIAALTTALSMLLAISITSEFEIGTMEMLLVTPINPLEVMIGKLLPNILLAYFLLYLILIVIRYLFQVPFYGSLFLLSVSAFPFIIANLSVGIAASCVSKSQFQAANIASVYALPAILFSGFLFPIAAMPIWGQWISYLLPGTYFLKITTDILLKNASFVDIWPNIWPMIVFSLLLLSVSYKFYKQTLD